MKFYVKALLFFVISFLGGAIAFGSDSNSSSPENVLATIHLPLQSSDVSIDLTPARKIHGFRLVVPESCGKIASHSGRAYSFDQRHPSQQIYRDRYTTDYYPNQRGPTASPLLVHRIVVAFSIGDLHKTCNISVREILPEEDTPLFPSHDASYVGQGEREYAEISGSFLKKHQFFIKAQSARSLGPVVFTSGLERQPSSQDQTIYRALGYVDVVLQFESARCRIPVSADFVIDYDHTHLNVFLKAPRRLDTKCKWLTPPSVHEVRLSRGGRIWF